MKTSTLSGCVDRGAKRTIAKKARVKEKDLRRRTFGRCSVHGWTNRCLFRGHAGDLNGRRDTEGKRVEDESKGPIAFYWFVRSVDRFGSTKGSLSGSRAKTCKLIEQEQSETRKWRVFGRKGGKGNGKGIEWEPRLKIKCEDKTSDTNEVRNNKENTARHEKQAFGSSKKMNAKKKRRAGQRKEESRFHLNWKCAPIW